MSDEYSWSVSSPTRRSSCRTACVFTASTPNPRARFARPRSSEISSGRSSGSSPPANIELTPASVTNAPGRRVAKAAFATAFGFSGCSAWASVSYSQPSLMSSEARAQAPRFVSRGNSSSGGMASACRMPGS